MLRYLALLCCVLALPVAAQQPDLSTADRAAIRSAIERQLAALRNDDAPAAFAFASPAIQAHFGNAAVFLSMVQAAYQPVYRPRYVEFKELLVMEATPTQLVYLVGPDGVPVLAVYRMEKQPDGDWRIDGCYLQGLQGEKL